LEALPMAKQPANPNASTDDDAPGIRPGLYVTEKECARRIGISVDKWHDIVLVLERQGLPLPDPLFCRRRYWPAVRAFLDHRYGIGPASGFLAPDGEENWDPPPKKKKVRWSDAHPPKESGK
jgi:hypothetical protein